jgi:hypothetical protein
MKKIYVAPSGQKRSLLYASPRLGKATKGKSVALPSASACFHTRLRSCESLLRSDRKRKPNVRVGFLLVLRSRLHSQTNTNLGVATLLKEKFRIYLYFSSSLTLLLLFSFLEP